jgi:hypothetical protein
MASTDPSRILEIQGSPWAMTKFLLMGLALTAISAAMAFSLLGGQPNVFRQFIGLAGLAFFGLATAIMLWRMVTSRGAVITLAPEGIRDIRVASGFIPWPAIRNIGTWRSFDQNVMVLTIDPAAEEKLRLTLIAKLTRRPNRSLGINGLCVTAHGLKINFSDLLATTRTYAQAARNQTPWRNGKPSGSAKIYKLH